MDTNPRNDMSGVAYADHPIDDRLGLAGYSHSIGRHRKTNCEHLPKAHLPSIDTEIFSDSRKIPNHS